MKTLMKVRTWLLPVLLICFILTAGLFPFAVKFTYAGRSESPAHILTYTTGNLTWDSATNVNPGTGVAELSLFSPEYQNVRSEDGDNVVAPGTEALNIVRLKNDVDSPIEYTAVLYRIKEESTLPVAPALTGSGFTDTHSYPLPGGVDKNQVVRAVTGTVEGGKIQDFDISWLWEYYESDQRDTVDTALGNKAAWATADEVMAGLYIVVAENPDSPDDPYTYPQVPKTGDSSNTMLYFALMILSGVLLFLLVLERRREKR